MKTNAKENKNKQKKTERILNNDCICRSGILGDELLFDWGLWEIFTYFLSLFFLLMQIVDIYVLL